MNQINRYLNGNYFVDLYDDGTKTRSADISTVTTLKPEFPDQIELKITNYCDKTCAGYDESKATGTIADILHNKIISDIKPYTEVSIIDCNALAHPALVKFIEELKSKNIDVDLTVNQTHLIDDLEKFGIVLELVSKKLLRCLSVRLTDSTDEKLYNLICKKLANVIIECHVGLTSSEDIHRLANHNLSLMILGFKQQIWHSRCLYQNSKIPEDIIAQNIQNMIAELKKIQTDTDKFIAIGFDTLAAKQLNILNPDGSCDYYIQDADEYSMFIDLANGEYAKSIYDERKPIVTKSMSINEMFKACHNKVTTMPS